MKKSNENTSNISCYGSVHKESDGLSILIEPWFDFTSTLPFKLPENPDISVFFFGLYRPADGSVIYVCQVEDSELRHEFDLTEQEREKLRRVMDDYCLEEEGFSLLDFWYWMSGD